ncbi:MAG TPA: DUF5808 domain-containing protein [Chloroflexota bacterium]|jgi:hypothetical protein|nr:DUF5808 domain-containing protein [Chloroflexota bacterium]
MAKRRTGRFLGLPYDLRVPTWARAKERWWNAKDRRVLTPKLFGWGYDLNFYELARRLRLVPRSRGWDRFTRWRPPGR